MLPSRETEKEETIHARVSCASPAFRQYELHLLENVTRRVNYFESKQFRQPGIYKMEFNHILNELKGSCSDYNSSFWVLQGCTHWSLLWELFRVWVLDGFIVINCVQINSIVFLIKFNRCFSVSFLLNFFRMLKSLSFSLSPLCLVYSRQLRGRSELTGRDWSTLEHMVHSE